MPYAVKDVHVIWRSYPEMESSKNQIVYLTELRRFGYLITLNAFVSRVLYVDNFGNEVDTFVENDEIEEWEEPFTYEQE